MKFLIILILFAVLAMFIFARFRRQIQTALYVFKMFRKMREMSKPKMVEKQIESNRNANDVQLVRCAKCGSWIQQNTAIKLSKNNFYCSSKCMEKAVEV